MNTFHRRRALVGNRRGAVAAALCVGLIALAACSSSDGDDGAAEHPSTTAPTQTTEPRPPGPAADLATEITGGKGVYIGEAVPAPLKDLGYEQHEVAAVGTARSYKASAPLPVDGRWALAPDASAPYRTRVLVRAPADPEAFSGTVIVEWMNVSGGIDAVPEWTNASEEIARAGDVWVGVSAQRIGVEGGPVLVEVKGIPGAEEQGKGVKAIDPTRYGSLEHPGDAYALDIYTQVARAVRDGAGLNGLKPERLIAAGESQSASALVSYIDGVQPLTHAFDGFLVHSRLKGALPLVAADVNVAITGAISGDPTIMRTDQDAPILDIQTETDILGVVNSYAARQPDGDRFRLWEMAGTAHADAHLIGPYGSALGCGVPINDGPMHLVAKAALRALTTWITAGRPPPKAPRLEVSSGATPQIQRDADGIARGGVRTPPVDVPVTALSGVSGPNPSTICLLLGSSAPLSAERLADLYPSRAEYRQRYEDAADEAIDAGFVLADDRGALMGFADPSAIAG